MDLCGYWISPDIRRYSKSIFVSSFFFFFFPVGGIRKSVIRWDTRILQSLVCFVPLTVSPEFDREDTNSPISGHKKQSNTRVAGCHVGSLAPFSFNPSTETRILVFINKATRANWDLRNNILKPSACWLCAHTTIPTNMIGSESKIHCRSAVRFGRASPGFFITTHHAYAFLM